MIEDFLLQNWRDTGEVDVSESFHTCLTKSICSLMFDMDTSEIAKLYTQLGTCCSFSMLRSSLRGTDVLSPPGRARARPDSNLHAVAADSGQPPAAASPRQAARTHQRYASCQLPVPSCLFSDGYHLTSLSAGAIEARRKQKDSSSKYNDLLQILSDTPMKDGSLLAPELIPFGIINVLLAATTSTPLIAAWTLNFLLQDPPLLCVSRAPSAGLSKTQLVL